MKVLLIAQNTNENSGWGRYAAAMGRSLKELGVDVSYLNESTKSSEQSNLFPLSPKTFLRNLFVARRSAKNADIVHALDGWPYGVYGYAAVIGTSKKLFINGIGSYSTAPFQNPFKGWLTGAAYRRAKKIFCISRYVEERMIEYKHFTNTEVVHLGLTELQTLTPREISEYKKKYAISSPDPIFLTVGEIKYRKGQLDTLTGLALLKKEFPDFLYCIVGKSDSIEYRELIDKAVAEHDLEKNVKIITDAKTDRDVAFFYQIADVFFLNSNNDGEHYEGFGLVFLEANQFGVPSIGSRGCGIEDAIENGYSGYLTNQKDAEDIKEKTLRILQNNRAVQADNVKEFASRFSWKKMAETYYRYYLES